MRSSRAAAAPSRTDSRRFVALLSRAVTAICGLLILHCGDAAANDVASTAGALHVAGWRVTAFGERAHGVACWIAGADTALRLEILALSDDVAVPDETDQRRRLTTLLARRGDGWTYARAGRDLPGLLNRWGERWRTVSPDLARLLQVISLTLSAGPPAADPRPPAVADKGRDDLPSASRWRAAAPGRHRSPEPLVKLGGDLWLAQPGSETADPSEAQTTVRWRRDLVARGRGRGGLAEVVTLAWITSAGVTPWPQLAVRSVRRAGTLYLWPLATEPVLYPAVETFLPLWPLQQLLDR